MCYELSCPSLGAMRKRRYADRARKEVPMKNKQPFGTRPLNYFAVVSRSGPSEAPPSQRNGDATAVGPPSSRAHLMSTSG